APPCDDGRALAVARLWFRRHPASRRPGRPRSTPADGMERDRARAAVPRPPAPPTPRPGRRERIRGLDRRSNARSLGGNRVMEKVLVALDNSLAGRSVVATAQALAPLFDAEVEAAHVQVDGARTARTTAEAAGVPLRVLPGPVVESLV